MFLIKRNFRIFIGNTYNVECERTGMLETAGTGGFYLMRILINFPGLHLADWRRDKET